jgi:hypothetical protein
MQKSVLMATLVLSLAACVFAACDGGDGEDETPTRPASTATVARTEVASRTPSGEIRERDLEANADVRGLIQLTAGKYVQENVIYADVTDDGVDDAIVPISSGGTLGNIAFVVLTPTEDGTEAVLRELPQESGGLAINVVDGKIVVLQPVYGPDDPECCPSMLRQTTYAWNGAAIALEDVKTIENPGGEVKPTPGQ